MLCDLFDFFFFFSECFLELNTEHLYIYIFLKACRLKQVFKFEPWILIHSGKTLVWILIRSNPAPPRNTLEVKGEHTPRNATLTDNTMA